SITSNGGVAVDAGSTSATLWLLNVISGNAINWVPPSTAGTSGVPTIKINPSALAPSGKSLPFTLSVNSVNSITDVLWDFSQGAPVTGTAATHTFAKAGTYRVTAIAWDSTGQAGRSEITLTVTTP